MIAKEAAEIINELRFMPGWTFEASPMDRFEKMITGVPADVEAVRLTHVIETVNTDRENAREGYPETRTVIPSTSFPTDTLHTRNDVIALVFASVMETFQHEAQEFLRDPSQDWAAIFHPHRPEGQAEFRGYFG